MWKDMGERGEEGRRRAEVGRGKGGRRGERERESGIWMHGPTFVRRHQEH